MATGWQAVEDAIGPWARDQLATQVLERLEYLESRPQFLAILSKDEIMTYLRTGDCKI
jgi:hypothetical protein